MSTDIPIGQSPLAGSAKTKWAKLTDADLMHADGDYDKLVDVICQRYGYARDQAAREVKEWLEVSPRNGRWRPTYDDGGSTE